MTTEERRGAILDRLRSQSGPLSASALARSFSVSRQIIVGDVALLRAAGAQILATPRGYLLSPAPEGLRRTVACLHTQERTGRELELCVDHGCTVQDVIVEHPVYGQLVGELELSSRYEVEQFLRRLEAESARALSVLTDGIHLHTLRCPSQEAFERLCQALEAEGFLIH